MPCLKKSNGKYGIGSGKGVYPDKATCERALKGYYASKRKHHSAAEGKFLEERKNRFGVNK